MTTEFAQALTQYQRIIGNPQNIFIQIIIHNLKS
jgi:hypothetical protein